MLSKKMAFSLVVFSILAWGFVLVPGTLAQTADPTVPLPVLSTLDELDEVVKKDMRRNQVALYTWGTDFGQPATASEVDTQLKIRDTVFPDASADERTGDVKLYLRLHHGYAILKSTGTPPAVTPVGADDVPPTDMSEDHYLHPRDLSISYFDKNGQPIADADGLTNADTKIRPRNAAFPDGQNFEITIAIEDIALNARYMTVSIAEMKFKNINPTLNFRDVGKWNRKSTLPDPGDPFKFKAYTADEAKAKGGTAKEGDPVDDPLELFLINVDPEPPKVISIVRTVTATSARSDATATQFGGDPVAGTFMVKVTFSEEPKLPLENNDDPSKGYKVADLPFRVDNAKITAIAKGTPFYVTPHYREGDYEVGADATPNSNVPDTTGYDRRYHPYLLTIEPDLATSNPISIYIQGFSDIAIPAKTYQPPNNAARINTREMLHVPVLATGVDKPLGDIDAYKNLAPRSNEYALPTGTVIPSQGYLVIASGDATKSGVPAVSADKYKDEDGKARADNQTDFNFKHNVLHSQALNVDLSLLFRSGATIQLRYNDIEVNTERKAALNKKTRYQAADATIAAGDVIISEVMWGRDESLEVDAAMSQWIELHNTTEADIFIDDREWVLNFGPSNALSSRHTTLVDEIGNDPTSGFWLTPGSDGVTTVSQTHPVLIDLVSMFRIPGAADGTAQASWAASPARGNSPNFTGRALGTPGGATAYTAPAPAPEPEPTPEPMAPVATAADLMITEIMVASNDGRLPQWIEITNGAVGEVSLNGWVLGIDNDPADTTVAALSLGIKLDGVTLGEGQSALVVSKTGRNSGVGVRSLGDSKVGILDANRIIDASSQVKPATMTDTLLSEMAFRIALEPPLPLTGGATDRGDVVGNLGGGWELPMSEAGRSSIIRREMGETETEIMGTDAAGWQLASETGLANAYLATYYGDKDDEGTPGYDAGGALPVELSKFGAKRDRVTGQVVVTWETQSELNNAGFFIKRSQQKNGQFAVVNPTMIAGAGTTSEKQSYTYTDTTASPNIVYYYQIEDVSLDGNRQTLTRAHRLKGHIGAAGKLTSTWGELKSSNE